MANQNADPPVLFWAKYDILFVFISIFVIIIFKESILSSILLFFNGLIINYINIIGILIGLTLLSFFLSCVMILTGGMWDSAKKSLESLSKDDISLQSAITGDIVGDPFKDTAGPSIHILMKLLSTITLVLVPVFTGVKTK